MQAAVKNALTQSNLLSPWVTPAPGYVNAVRRTVAELMLVTTEWMDVFNDDELEAQVHGYDCEVVAELRGDDAPWPGHVVKVRGMADNVVNCVRDIWGADDDQLPFLVHGWCEACDNVATAVADHEDGCPLAQYDDPAYIRYEAELDSTTF